MSFKIDWVFFFEGDHHIKSSITDEEQDIAIQKNIQRDHNGILTIPGTNFDLMINLSKVKCISRTPIKDEQINL